MNKKYNEIIYLPNEEITSLLDSNDEESVCYAIHSMATYMPDTKLCFEQLLKLLENNKDTIQQCAITGISTVFRRDKTICVQRAIDKIAELGLELKFDGIVSDLIDDINIFGRKK
tara:strand:+ start:748 stop:1092 length:345 start_codon:yes stop_codon:yes gene_type:complete